MGSKGTGRGIANERSGEREGAGRKGLGRRNRRRERAREGKSKGQERKRREAGSGTRGRGERLERGGCQNVHVAVLLHMNALLLGWLARWIAGARGGG